MPRYVWYIHGLDLEQMPNKLVNSGLDLEDMPGTSVRSSLKP
jgi:hypothetical protein